MQESHWSTSLKSFFFYLCRALNKYHCGQNLLTSTLGLVEHKEQHLVLNCSSMSGMNHRSFHWQCTGRCWSSTQCWNQLRGTNPQCPLALLGHSYKEDVLHPTFSIRGFDFLGDLQEPYNFVFRMYCRSFVSVPHAWPGGLEEGVALWSWGRRSAGEFSFLLTCLLWHCSIKYTSVLVCMIF